MFNKFQHYEFSHQVGKRRTTFVVATLAFLVVGQFVSSILGWGWITAAFLAFGLYLAYLIFILYFKDKFFGLLLIFSTISGFVELVADHWLVDVTKTLIYVQPEPLLWVSPIYMPFAWAVVLLQIGYIGLWILEKYSMVFALIATGLLGGSIIPLYEHLAKNADWWYYVNSPSILNAPYYIIFGEFLICLPLPYIQKNINIHRWGRVISYGVLHGLWIWLAYFITFNICG